MDLHLGVINGGGDMVNRACDCVCGMTAKVWSSDGSGGDICAQLCVYVFRYVWIGLYDVGRCKIDVLINLGEVD